MKKSKILIIIGIIFICSGCNGNITREIRHSGFSLNNGEFVCNDFMPENEEDKNYFKMKYLGGTYALTEDGDIYDISLDLKYSNGKNCKKADTSLRVKSTFDNKIFRANDDSYYYLVDQNEAKAFTIVSSTDNGYLLYKLLLGDNTNLKVQSVDGGVGSYYILKDDGNVYKYIVTRENGNSGYVIMASSVAYNKKDFGGKIIDFYYAGNSLNTYIKTNDAVYRMKVTNKEECNKYADVSCEYKLVRDEMFDKYKDIIITYNGSVLITSYGKMFSVTS